MSESERPPSADPPPKVLVVEDEVLIRMGVANALRDAGYIVYEAATATEAIDIVSAGVIPDVLFTDVLLPGRLDGLQLAALLESSLPDLVVVVSSGRLLATDVKLPLNFVAKPFEPGGVVRHISRALQR